MKQAAQSLDNDRTSADGRAGRRSHQRKVLILRTAILVGATLLLETACVLHIIPASTLVPPSDMALALARLLGKAAVWEAMLRTSTNVLISCAAAIISGIGLGIMLHAIPRVRSVLEPVFSSYYAVPIFAFYPLLVLLLGLNDIPIILVGYFGAVVAVIVNTIVGLDRVPRVLMKYGLICRMSPLSMALRIRLPAAAPALFIGVKLAVAYSFTGVIASEFLLSDYGLGYSVAFAYNSFNMQDMYGFMLLVILLAAAVTMTFHIWEERLAARMKR
jgi:NitT/TauT family transport system permease protein